MRFSKRQKAKRTRAFQKGTSNNSPVQTDRNKQKKRKKRMATWQRAPLLIFDFDETLVEQDSSRWVAGQLGGGELFERLMRDHGMTWHASLNATLHSLHEQAGGASIIASIEDALRRIPICPATVAALKAAHAIGCELIVVSDANTFFINAVLQHHDLAPFFSRVYGNPACVDGQGRLCYSSFHSSHLPPHGCPLCPPNMCKGSVVKRELAMLLAEADARGNDSCSRRRVLYFGDGGGDFCPSLQLGQQDCVLPRNKYELHAKLLALSDQQEPEASVHPWDSIAEGLLHKLQDILNDDPHKNEVLPATIVSSYGASADLGPVPLQVRTC
ncbi:hypothetical protein L7F22_005166 [Adiantum nelumboides]|nr:hypothetical protein [Adiantum nelumboides]